MYGFKLGWIDTLQHNYENARKNHGMSHEDAKQLSLNIFKSFAERLLKAEPESPGEAFLSRFRAAQRDKVGAAKKKAYQEAKARSMVAPAVGAFREGRASGMDDATASAYANAAISNTSFGPSVPNVEGMGIGRRSRVGPAVMAAEEARDKAPSVTYRRAAKQRPKNSVTVSTGDATYSDVVGVASYPRGTGLIRDVQASPVESFRLAETRGVEGTSFAVDESSENKPLIMDVRGQNQARGRGLATRRIVTPVSMGKKDREGVLAQLIAERLPPSDAEVNGLDEAKAEKLEKLRMKAGKKELSADKLNYESPFKPDYSMDADTARAFGVAGDAITSAFKIDSNVIKRARIRAAQEGRPMKAKDVRRARFERVAEAVDSLTPTSDRTYAGVVAARREAKLRGMMDRSGDVEPYAKPAARDKKPVSAMSKKQIEARLGVLRDRVAKRKAGQKVDVDEAEPTIQEVGVDKLAGVAEEVSNMKAQPVQKQAEGGLPEAQAPKKERFRGSGKKERDPMKRATFGNQDA